MDRSTGLICDQAIALKDFYAAKDYPPHPRRIRYHLDAGYSAACEALDRGTDGRRAGARGARVYARGIEVAEKRGDRQAANEMRVFSKRLTKAAAAPERPPKDD